IHLYQSFNADISKPLDAFAETMVNDGFDYIICDAPCSGSGTWSRTPEQLVFFDKEKIENYTLLQKNIVANAIQYLLKGGYFLYITCSVFKKENEEVAAFIQRQLQLVQQQVLKGYDNNADTMFAALFKK
ncbi:MAG TPA: Fmu (Sun) domain-containing protein, partial [Chitinophagaceae bacterium]|nr:Fmu (Sun) domain-containing protein [Chitinophagaceae bacterium]